MSDQLPYLRPVVTPTEAATYYSLIIAGAVGGIGTYILSQMIKEKNEIPIKSLATWTLIFGVVTVVSVYNIAKASK